MSRRYSVRVLRFEEGGSVLAVKGPRMPRVGYVASCAPAAFELVARAEVRRMRGARWMARQESPSLVVLTDRMSGRKHRFPSPSGPVTSWQQAALFLQSLRAKAV